MKHYKTCITNRINISILIIAVLVNSCTLMNRIFLSKQISSQKGHSKNCRLYTSVDTTALSYFEKLVDIAEIHENDSILSIGAGSGGREFLISLFTNNILFYLEDIDTSCISRKRIDSIYLPHYSQLRGEQITNNFITITGTDTTIFLSNNSVNKVFIHNAYHHFSNDIAIIKECRRVLTQRGKLIIGENVLKRNRKSFRFCDYGGYYKTEDCFIKDIVACGFIYETIYRKGKHSRLFIFIKS